MKEKLTYEEWRLKHTAIVTDEVRKGLKEFHNIDADSEIESLMRKEYEFYLNGEVEE